MYIFAEQIQKGGRKVSDESKIIDISGWNTNVDYAKIKSTGVEGAILRITEKGNGADSMFDKHYKGLKNADVPVLGGYKYSYALSIQQIHDEAWSCVNTLKNYPDFHGMIFLDIEDSTQSSLGKTTISNFVNEFRKIVEANDYSFGVYANKNFFNNYIDTPNLNCPLWVASYPSSDNGNIVERLRPSYTNQIGWQYTENHRIGNQGYDCSLFSNDWIFSVTASKSDNIVIVDEPLLIDEEPVQKADDSYWLINPGTRAEDILNIARGWLGLNEADGSHMKIVNIYNNHLPRARGYALNASDSWCDCFVSTCFIVANATDLIGGTECGVEEHVKKFIAAGIWIEDGTITPLPGDIIVFNWDQGYQPNNGYSDHIGIVESVSGGYITTIEGNANDMVMRRRYAIGHGNIRGFARPKYGSDSSTTLIVDPTTAVDDATDTTAKDKDTVAYTILKIGSIGNDVIVMQKLLIALGYDCGSYGADGDFGNDTQESLKLFQKQHGLEETAVYTLNDKTQLERSYNNSVKKTYPMEMFTIKDPKSYLREGASKNKRVIAKPPVGTKVNITKEKLNSAGNKWLKGSLEINETKFTGWIVATSLTY